MTTTTRRNDVHSPANLVTEDYEYLFAFDNDEPGFLVGVDMDWWRSITNFDPELRERGTRQCHHCGAHLRYVALLRHVPSGHAIAVGETCVDNRFDRATADFQRLRQAAALDRKAQRIKTAAAAFVAALPEGDAKKALTRDADLSQFVGLDAFAVNTITDIRRKIWDLYGDASERQVAFVARLIAQGAERATREAQQAEEITVPAPTGRVTFEGQVVSRRWKDSDYGGAFKLTIKVTEPNGVWLAWVSEPSAIETERGDIVRLTATLTPSNDKPHFAFGKRPSKAQVVGHAEVTESALD